MSNSFLLGEQAHGQGGEVGDLLRLHALVVVNVLLDRVVFGEHVQNFALVHALLYSVQVTLLLGVQNFLPLRLKHMLAPLESGLQLALLFQSLAELPLCLVDDVMFDPDRVQLSVKLAPICVESVGSRAVIRQNLRLEDRLV